MKHLNGWQRLGILASIIWSIFVIGVFINEYTKVNDFEKVTSGFCPRISDGPFLWYDSKTGTQQKVGGILRVPLFHATASGRIMPEK